MVIPRPAYGARYQSNRRRARHCHRREDISTCLAGPGIRLYRYRRLRLAETHLLAGLHVQRAGWG